MPQPVIAEPMFRKPGAATWHIYTAGFYWWAEALCGYKYDGHNQADPEYRMDGEPHSDWCKNCLRVWQKEPADDQAGADATQAN